MKKKNYIPLILIIVFIIILVIILTKTHKKDKFDYSMLELKDTPRPINPIVKNFRFKFTNLTDFNCYTDIKKRNKPNDEKNDKVILSNVYAPTSETKFIIVSNDSPTIQLIVNTRIFDEDFKDQIINIDNPEFDYNILKVNAITSCRSILTIPNKPYNPYDDYNPKFRITNEEGDIRFEYKIKIIEIFKDNSVNTLLETKTYNNKCNNGNGYFSNWFSVPINSVVSITYRSCILPGFEKTVTSGRLNKQKLYEFQQNAKYSIFGTWYPNLIFKELQE